MANRRRHNWDGWQTLEQAMTVISPTVGVKIDPLMKQRVQRLAKARKRTQHWVIREALEQYVTREEGRDALRQDVTLAWKEYEETGLHVTGDEAIAWLETWGTDAEKTAPQCHV
jgi:predicted transcriptional regulator